MARGLLHGATVTLLCGFLAVMFSMFSPMWLVLRTELEEKQCWYGEGIWVSRYWWGSDLPLIKLECKDPKGLGPFSTATAYCDNHRPVYKHDSPDYNSKMCHSTNQAKVTSILATLFAFLSVSICSAMGLAGGSSTSSTYCAKSLMRPLTRRQEFFGGALALLSTVAVIVFTGTTTIIMLKSPLFSESHRNALSKYQVGVPFSGFASCSFQTPMHSIFSLLGSGPMECLFPGPSFFVILIIAICQLLGGGFLLLLLYDLWQKKALQCEESNQLSRPLLTDGTNSARGLSFEEHDDLLPLNFHSVRRYSLYGALARRFSKLGPISKFCLLTVAPVIFMVGNAVAWAVYSMLGIQIIVAAEMSFISSESLLYRPDNESVVLWENPPQLLLEKIEDQYRLYGGMQKKQTFFRDIMNVFNFSPVTSLEYFWANEAYIIAVAVFLAIFIIPILKVVCWIWFYYAPSDEFFRGRFLGGLDTIGKYALANLYVFCFLAIALCFESDFIKISLGNSSWFLFKIRAAVNAGSGVGSYMYVLTSIMSLLIGQFMCQVHSFASSWEEDRRARLSITKGGDMTGPIMDSNLLDSPDYTVGDTPYMVDLPVHGSSSAAAPSSIEVAQIPRTASVEYLVPALRSLASFGSTADLRRMQQQNGNMYSQIQPPEIMRALASFGSRTALNVLAAREKSRGNRRPREAIAELNDEEDENEDMQCQVMQRSSLDEEIEDGVDGNNRTECANLSDPIHPYVEAMCDRVHSPLQGMRLRWTPRGKIFVWLHIFLLAGFVLVCQSWDLIEIHKKGIAGDFIVKPQDRFQLYSLVTVTGPVAQTGYSVPAFELSTLFFIMTAVMPVLTTLGLAMMWTIPLTLDQQAILFNWLEIASAWSSLDIFFISIIAMYIEIRDVCEKIISDAVPNLSELIRIILPFEDGVMSVEMKIENGFWVLLVAVILEKIAIYLITEQAVTAISERRAEQFLRGLAKQTDANTSHRAGPLDSGLAEIDTGLLGDAAEGLLETDAMAIFAPTGRYLSATFSKHVYAGLPRAWWVSLGVRFGLLADAKTVARYDRTGEWFELDRSQVQPSTPPGSGGVSVTAPAVPQLSSAEYEPNLRASSTSRGHATSSNKTVSWGRLDEENANAPRASVDDDGPLSF